MTILKVGRRPWAGLSFGILAALAVGIACNSGTGPVGSNGSSDGDNVLLNDALSNDGTLSGKVVDTQSTRASTVDTSTGQTVPPEFDTASAVVYFKDLAGNVLTDPNGAAIPGVPLASDGTFDAASLPVGVDFIVCVDLGDNGTCDFESVVNIPADEQGDAGTLVDAQIDPLTTLILAKLRALLEERGIDPGELPISPVALATRVIEAYTHLFEETGIDHELSLEDIEALTPEELGALFDAAVPAGAQAGMHVVKGNLDLVRADDVEAVALAAAEVFLRAGFPIADDPEGLDFAPLGNLDGVESMLLSELFAMEDPFNDDFMEVNDDLHLAPAQADFGPIDATVYINVLTEPDRNFAEGDGKEGPHLPVMHEHLLLEMASLQLEGRRVTISDLHEVMTNLEDGMGARLTYFIFDPKFFGPPLNVFETADGMGKAINMEELFFSFFEKGFGTQDHEEMDRLDAELRTLLVDLLGDTVEPSLDRLAGAFMSERIAGMKDLTDRIRNARAHLPFSRTGPSMFYVVADGDAYRPDAGLVSPVSVDAEIGTDGTVHSVTYNAAGDGQHYLMFSGHTSDDGSVELLVRDAGRPLHGPRGPVRISMHDQTIFGDIDGVPFIEFVSETGNFFPGVNVSVVSGDYVPEPFDSPEVMVAEENFGNPNHQIFVLAESYLPGSEPVRVDYDMSTGVTNYNPAGRHLLQFLPETQDTGMFALFNEDTGRPAGMEDPASFFDAPPPPPENYDDLFNVVDDFAVFEGVEDLTDLEYLGDLSDLGYLDDLSGLGYLDDFGYLDNLADLGYLGDLGYIDQLVDGGELPPPPDGDAQPPPEEDVPPAQLDPLPDEPVSEPVEGTDDTVVSEPPPVDDFFIGDEPPLDEPPDDQYFGGDEQFLGGFVEPQPILVAVDQVNGLALERSNFTFVFGTEVANTRYNSDGDPYFDDLNGDGLHDGDEPTSPFRPMLFDSQDWRSTDIRMYYRRADNNGGVSFEEVDFESATPRTLDGVDLVSRKYVARLNAFRFGRPNTAVNLLTAFMPPEFFDGAHGLTGATTVDVFGAVAIVNLMMDQVHNVEADIDIDGFGPMAKERMLMDAHIFIPPVGDPFTLLMKGFVGRTEIRESTQ